MEIEQRLKGEKCADDQNSNHAAGRDGLLFGDMERQVRPQPDTHLLVGTHVLLAFAPPLDHSAKRHKLTHALDGVEHEGVELPEAFTRPPVEEIPERLTKAKQCLSSRPTWVNPDCGLKTRK